MNDRPLPGSSPRRTARSPIGRGGEGHPGRGAFFIARVSRHEVPTTPGIPSRPYHPDPLRVAPSYDRPLAGSRGKRGDVGFPGSSSGLTPLLDTWAMNDRPQPGSSPQSDGLPVLIYVYLVDRTPLCPVVGAQRLSRNLRSSARLSVARLSPLAMASAKHFSASSYLPLSARAIPRLLSACARLSLALSRSVTASET